jgi:hypothetical protein
MDGIFPSAFLPEIPEKYSPSLNPTNHSSDNALVIEAYTGLWLTPAQYERIARAAGNAQSF